jgi:hypothetical protein
LVGLIFVPVQLYVGEPLAPVTEVLSTTLPPLPAHQDVEPAGIMLTDGLVLTTVTATCELAVQLFESVTTSV